MDVNNELDGARQESPGAGPLDPIAGIRAMADIQAEGLRAASDLLDRVLDRDAPVAPSPNGRNEREYVPLLDAWASLLERVAAGLTPPGDGTLVAIDSDEVGPAVRIHWADGASSEVEISLRNPADQAAGPLRFACGRLSSADGAALIAAELLITPGEVAELPARGSATIVVSLRTERAPPAGIYRGTLQAAGAPLLWLPIEVTVEPC